MSHILEFKITDLAGRKDVYKHKLNRDLNVFYGLNGSGKTSLLRILDSAMSGDVDILRIVPFESAEVTIRSIHYQREFVRTISKCEIMGEPLVGKRGIRKRAIPTVEIEEVTELPYQLSFPPSGKKIKWKVKPSKPDTSDTSWSHIYLPTWRLYPSSDLYTSLLQREPGLTAEREYDLDILFGRRLEEIWSRYTNQLLSEIQKIQEDGLANILKGMLAPRRRQKKHALIDSQMAYQRVGAFLERQGSPGILGDPEVFERRYNAEPQIRKIVEDINSIEQRIEKSRVSRNRLEQLIQDMFSGNKKIVFKDTGITVESGEGQDIGLASLSSGEKQALWIFIETMFAEENTLLIDEPEISMHIDWQEKLLSSMQQLSSNAQIIVATHSPGIMAKIPDDKIFSL